MGTNHGIGSATEEVKPRLRNAEQGSCSWELVYAEEDEFVVHSVWLWHMLNAVVLK